MSSHTKRCSCAYPSTASFRPHATGDRPSEIASLQLRQSDRGDLDSDSRQIGDLASCQRSETIKDGQDRLGGWGGLRIMAGDVDAEPPRRIVIREGPSAAAAAFHDGVILAGNPKP